MLFACLLLNLWLMAAAADVSLNITGSSTQDKPEVVHCFCNLMQCITSGYMCKSQGKGCFSDLQTNMDIDRALHGCLDLLPKEKHDFCRNVPSGSLNGDGNLPSSNGSNSSGRHKETNPPSSLLLCCHQDMCNHIDSQETRTKYNETILAVGGVMGSSVDLGSVHGDWRGGYENIRWFKVATIAVPICGALILLVLIALALKILSHETLHHTPLGVKLREKHHHHMFPDVGMGSGFGGGDVQNHRAECGSSSEKKLLPLLYHENDTGCGGRRTREGEPTKNEAYAKLNCALAGAGDAACRSTFLSATNTKNTTSCNLLYNHHQYAFSHPPLLTLGQPDKLDYKRILPSHHLPAYR